MKRVDKRVSRHPGERWRRRIFQIRLAGAEEQHDFTAGTKKRLKREQRSDFDPNGANRDEV